jgi:lipopolysaccharide biosynthesis glycosyltransferase
MDEKQKNQTAIVICADRGVFALLVGLLRSLTPLDRSKFVICIIDVGLTDEQCDYLYGICDRLEKVSNDLLIMPHEQISAVLDKNVPFWRAQMCRPFLRDYFPGFKHYIHLDGDTWFQNLAMLDAAVAQMDEGNIVIVPEADVAYPFLNSHEKNYEYFIGRHKLVTRFFDVEIEKLAATLPYYNTGLFCMPANAPHWDLFREYLSQCIGKGYQFLVEQLAFNVAMFVGKNYSLLPATCNWMCSVVTPIKINDKWCSPIYPFTEIDMLHLGGSDKLERYSSLGLLYGDGVYVDEIRHLFAQ